MISRLKISLIFETSLKINLIFRKIIIRKLIIIKAKMITR